MKSFAPLAFAAGVVLGALGAFTATSWRRAPREGTYCVRCALHRETLARRVRERQGALYGLLSASLGAHEHRWADAVSARSGEQRALDRESAQTELEELDALERDPIAIAVLVEAWRADRDRAARFTRALIDPTQHIDRAAIGLIQRTELSWADRWRVVDGFFEQYRCRAAPEAITCTLPVGAVSVVAWHQVPGSVLRGPVPWTTWTPPGFVATAPPVFAPSPPPPVVAMTPIPPPTPRGTAPEAPLPTEVPSATPTAPGAGGASRDVERAIGLARTGQVEAAARDLARLQRVTPQPAGLGRLREAVRQRSVAHIDDMILSGRCAEAQRFARSLRALGCPVNAQDHFGSACPGP